jgi:cyclopropane-fatty-acyl-phospholipid synthase
MFTAALGYRRLLHLSDEIALLEDCGLGVASVTDLTASYASTLRRWLENLHANRDRIEELSPGFARVLQTHMTIARLSFCTRTELEYAVLAGKGLQRPSA